MNAWQQRVVHLGIGLALVGLAIIIAKIWIAQENAARADSVAFRGSVTTTLDAIDRLSLELPEHRASLSDWREFLQTPRGQRLPVSWTHEFVDSFVVRYRDGQLDSAETVHLARQLGHFRP